MAIRQHSPHAKSKTALPQWQDELDEPEDEAPLTDLEERQYNAREIALRDIWGYYEPEELGPDAGLEPKELAKHRRLIRRWRRRYNDHWTRGDERRLYRLLGFVQRPDLNRLSEHDLEQLQHEIAAFCLHEGRVGSVGVGNTSREEVLSPHGPFSFTRRKLARLAAELRADIDDALNGLPVGPVPTKRTIEYDPKEKKAYEYFDAKPEALLRWNVQTLVLRCADRINKCVTPKCGRLFIKVKRQIRCSAQCGQKQYSSAYRNNPENREKIANSRHLSYKARIRKEEGEKAARKRKVRRRPRKEHRL
jgi:hypothetical protein